ncbi:MAG TPA: iron-containing alcohol dehydrogenase [Actinomycetota bacterium]|nr:iron-containing alcohol dehydrogenase [Actinomycetota bacterium]
MEFPQVLIFDGDDENAAAAELAAQVSALGLNAPLVLASQHGSHLAAQLASSETVASPAHRADQEWASELGARARRAGADAVVAVGGGRCLDIAKLAAARAGLPSIAVPTQLSHDGICSPVAVVPNEHGRAESVGAIAPRVVFIAIPTLIRAPAASLRAGIGDLLANPLALRDWALAAQHGLEEIDQRAWDLSVESFETIEDDLNRPVDELAGKPEFARRLANALVLSGLAMIWSGTSRPASGGEHEISHAIDELYGGRAMHGEQVAFGCTVSVALYGEDTDAFRGRLRNLGLPDHPRDLGLSSDDMVQLLLHAPDTRPGRFTILEDATLDEAGAGKLVSRIWGQP